MASEVSATAADARLRQVLEAFANTPVARLKAVMTAPVDRLHAFTREVELTSAERRAAAQFLTRVGQTCTPMSRW